ncbi:MAG: HIT family protein [Chromatiales bacterium]|nr:HIT family protein [Chromatiales bacterium]
MTDPSCPFCTIEPARLLHESTAVRILRDGFPVSPGHLLLVPRRHVESWFEATPEEQQALTAAIAVAKALVEREHQPDGYNVGMNLGPAAGQTVMHLHLHVIPRYRGDVADPRGGVRWVLPGRADYWSGRR